jgi:DNA-binding phage protein
MRDPEFRAAYAQAAGEIAQTDYIIRTLDELRTEMGISKAELARRIDRNASSVRRLFTARQARPELPLITAVAEALGLRLAIVPESPEAKQAVREHHGGRKELIAA